MLGRRLGRGAGHGGVPLCVWRQDVFSPAVWRAMCLQHRDMFILICMVLSREQCFKCHKMRVVGALACVLHNQMKFAFARGIFLMAGGRRATEVAVTTYTCYVVYASSTYE